MAEAGLLLEVSCVATTPDFTTVEAGPSVQDLFGRFRFGMESGLSLSELLEGKCLDLATGACRTVIGKAANRLREELEVERSTNGSMEETRPDLRAVRDARGDWVRDGEAESDAAEQDT